jgi:hypothetical protein
VAFYCLEKGEEQLDIVIETDELPNKKETAIDFAIEL